MKQVSIFVIKLSGLQLQVINSDSFFRQLNELGIRKSEDPYEPLRDQIAVNKEVPDILLIDKIKRVLKEADKNMKQKMISTRVTYNTMLNILQRRTRVYETKPLF